MKTPTTFDLLEPLSNALKANGAPKLSQDLKAGFARGTEGIALDWIIEKIVAAVGREIPADRKRAYKIINGERDYQDTRWTEDHSPAEWLVYIQHYLNVAVVAASTKADPESSQEVMESIRKIGAMCVAAMEQNQTPVRGGQYVR